MIGIGPIDVNNLTQWTMDATRTRSLVPRISIGGSNEGAYKMIKDYLAGMGYCDGLVPNAEKIAELREHIDGAENVIFGFKQRKPEVYYWLLEDVRKAYVALAPESPEPPGFG